MPKGLYKRTPEILKKMSIAHLGQKGYWTGKKRPEISDEKHFKWKGIEAGYRALHIWVEKRLGKPRFCEHCGNRELGHRHYHWANISRKYKRDLKDWLRLCAKCHKKYDK